MNQNKKFSTKLSKQEREEIEEIRIRYRWTWMWIQEDMAKQKKKKVIMQAHISIGAKRLDALAQKK
jgi:hypothetical protein